MKNVKLFENFQKGDIVKLKTPFELTLVNSPKILLSSNDFTSEKLIDTLLAADFEVISTAHFPSQKNCIIQATKNSRSLADTVETFNRFYFTEEIYVSQKSLVFPDNSNAFSEKELTMLKEVMKMFNVSVAKTSKNGITVYNLMGGYTVLVENDPFDDGKFHVVLEKSTAVKMAEELTEIFKKYSIEKKTTVRKTANDVKVLSNVSKSTIEKWFREKTGKSIAQFHSDNRGAIVSDDIGIA
jgi:hypothetical protein